jgi:DNA polymerase
VEISEIKKCTRCPELVANRKNVVALEGHCPAEILFLTNAPRSREDTQKRPLAGLSGKFFRETVNLLRINENYRIAYLPVVMCIPPERQPTDEEIQSCSSNIQSLIRAIQPKVVVAMGVHTHSFVLDVPLHNIRPTENCGETVYSDFNGALPHQVPVILTFDPNEVLQHRMKFEGMYVRHLRAAARLVFVPPQK